MQTQIAPKRQLTPLDNYSGSLATKAYHSLKNAILSLAYQPGEILRKGEVCEVLGISRSPVSEAVARLANEGLVNVVPQAGTFISRFSMAEIREGAFVREALELAAVEHVAGNVTKEQLDTLQQNLREQQSRVKAGDIAGFYRLDGEMHRLIMSFTGFNRLAKIADNSWVQVDRARQLHLPTPGRVQETLQEHQMIVAAIAAKDIQRARHLTRQHLGQLIKYLEPLEQQRPELFESG